MSKTLLHRSLVVLSAAGLSASALLGIPASASAAPPITVTQPSVSFTMPATSYAKDYAGVRINLHTVPNPIALVVTVECKGTAPMRADLVPTDPTLPDEVTFILHAPKTINGKVCTISGTSTVRSQSVVFAPGTYFALDKGVLITTVQGLVVIHSAKGGL